MCLQAQLINDDNSGVGRERQAQVIDEYYGSVEGGQGIDNSAKGSETTTEAAGT